ncbi:MAG TPA: VTT domain-containing protein [Terracidiphilus sp.]|nr:VTT domain-containing protein [Terracidiphilus sp.]
MELPTHILMVYGYVLLFAWVLFEGLGLPLPATPVVIAAGALTVDGHLSFAWAFIAGVAACVIADSTWFFVGRRYGHLVLRIICKLSLEPTTCVRRTHESFSKRGGVALLFAKFVPGLASLTAPVAGQNGMKFPVFLGFDAMGGMIWMTTLMVTGRLFGDALKRDPSLLNWAGRFSGALLVVGIVGFFVFRLIRRNMVLKQLASSRLEPGELMRLLESGESVYIVDLRHPLELMTDPFVLPGAQHFAPDALEQRASEIPRDRDVVLYCTCPSEATAAKTALSLHRLGIERVRPLRGGFYEWKRLGFPMDAIPPVNPMVVHVQPAK